MLRLPCRGLWRASPSAANSVLQNFGCFKGRNLSSKPNDDSDSTSARFQSHPRKLSPLEHAAAAANAAITGSTDAFFQPPKPKRVDLEETSFASTSGRHCSASGQPAPEIGSKKHGVLQSVPPVAPAKEHYNSAVKRAAKVSYSSGIRNEAEKERNKAARQLDTFMKELSVPLTRYLCSFPDVAKLHSFDSALLQLTVGTSTYTSTLAKVDALRKAIQEVGKSYANKAANAANKAAAIEAATEGMLRLQVTYQNGACHVDQLKDISKKLRTLPLVDVSLPTLALVGAPNVGKSSLVRVLSSGTPEVCNYPFTTRSIQMGHFYLDQKKHQVTDTPGLLYRPDGERNKMEQLTLAALTCLDTTVVFVADLTEECGTSIWDQWHIRAELKKRFPEKTWIDVLSKADCLRQVADQANVARHAGAGSGTEASSITAPSTVGTRSASSGQPEQPESSSRKQTCVTGTSTPLVCNAEEFAAAVPGAVWVSSVTKQGLRDLQQTIINVLANKPLLDSDAHLQQQLQQ